MSIFQLQPFAAEREWTVDGIPVLTASVSLPEPVPAADKTARRILRYYRLQCRAYLRYCEKWLLPPAQAAYRSALETSAPLPCFHASLEYRVTLQDPNFLSLYTQSREMTPAGRTLLTRRGDTWDLAAGYPIPLSDFFPVRSPWKRQLMAWAAQDIQRQEREGTARYSISQPGKLRRQFHTQNYYLTPEGLTIFFPMYAIAPSAEGIPAFTIPYARLQSNAFSRFLTEGEP